jgi:hypothetical protein
MRTTICPQSSSASRFTAGACGFFDLIQCRDRRELYGESRRFDTMPSRPSLYCPDLSKML